MTKKQTKTITALTIAAVILALMVSGRFWYRLDLTKSKAYTISKVSRNLYRELPNPVHITYYLSDKLRTETHIVAEIEDTLREYASYSRGRIQLSVKDPVKTGVSVTVEEFGLSPMQVSNVEQDQASLATVYSGIVIEYLDKIEIIPWVGSTNTLEYDITSRIRSMVNDTERVIGVIIGDGYRGMREDYGYLEVILASSGYRIRQIFPGEEIPDNLPGLFVLGGAEELDNWALYRIDRYIQLGGRVFFCVSGIYVDTFYGTLQARPQEDLGLLDMIASYGVIIRPEIALDRNALQMQYQSVTPSGSWQYKLARYPPWIGILSENGNRNHPVSASFTGLDLYWASPLDIYPLENVQSEILFTSSDDSWVMREAFHTNPDILYMMEMEYNETKGKKTLGVALTGQFRSFFRGSKKPVREGSDEELPDMPLQAASSRIIVVGNLDFATNMLAATQALHNLDFLLRVADWLVNDEDIIGIRNRQPQAGRFDKIADPAKRASAMRFTQILNVFVVPFLVIAAGVILAYRRRLRSKVKSGEASGDI